MSFRPAWQNKLVDKLAQCVQGERGGVAGGGEISRVQSARIATYLVPCIVNRRLRPLDAYAKYLSAAGKAQRKQLPPSPLPLPCGTQKCEPSYAAAVAAHTHFKCCTNICTVKRRGRPQHPLSLSLSLSACLAPKCMLHIIIDGVRQRDEYAVVRT